MTLGIGVLCDHGETFVLGSEQRASYGASKSSIQIDPNDEAGKVFRLKPYRIFFSVAGCMSTCHQVYSQFAHLVDHLKDKTKIPPELLMDLIDEARFWQMRRIYDWEIRKKMGITLREWASGKLPRGIKMHKMIVQYGEEILRNTPLKMELIVGGFIEPHGMFFRAVQKEALQQETSPGVYAIGVGQVTAMRHLNRRGQNVHMTLPRTLLHVYEALYLSQSQYVGPPPEFVLVVRNRESRIMIYPTASLEGWRKTYENRVTTASLDDSGIAAKEVMARLKVLKEKESEIGNDI